MFWINLFISGYAGSSPLHTGFSLAVEGRGYSLVLVGGLLSGPSGWASHCRGFSCGTQAPERRPQKLCCRSFVAPKHMESSRSRDWIPVPALPSRFLTPGPPGKSEKVFCLFHFIFWLPYGMWELSSLTREQTCALAVEGQSPNDWTTGESLCFDFNLKIKKKKTCTLCPLTPEASGRSFGNSPTRGRGSLSWPWGGELPERTQGRLDATDDSGWWRSWVPPASSPTMAWRTERKQETF